MERDADRFEIVWDVTEQVTFIYRYRTAGVCGPATSHAPASDHADAELHALLCGLVRSAAWRINPLGVHSAPLTGIFKP